MAKSSAAGTGVRPLLSRLNAGARVGLFVTLLGAAAVAMFVAVVRDLPGPDAPLDLPWPAWVALFAASEFLVVHVQLQRDSHSLSLTDLAFVAGLYLIEPATLVTAQVAGVGLTLLLQRRQFSVKFAFNLAQYALAGCLATTVFTVLSQDTVLSGSWSWVAALAGVTVSTLTVSACVFAVMWLSEGAQGVAGLPRMLGLSIAFALGVAAVGLLVATTAMQNPASLGLLALPSVLLIAAYRAYTRAREQQNNLRLLHEVTSLLYDSDDAPTALTDFLTAVRGAFRAHGAELVLFGEEDAVPTLSRSRDGEKPLALLPLEHREDADRLVTWAETTGVPTTRTGLDAGAELDRYTARHALKDAMVSVLSTEGRVQGLLLVSGRLGDVGTFTSSDLELLETFARHVATSLDRGRLETDLRRIIELQEELRHAAMHDPLTQLPNRTLFLDRTENGLNLAGRNGQWPAVLYLDLDGFKPVNDTYGHQAGDLLLKVFAQRLHEAVRTADTAARLGGDEFAVLLHGPIDAVGVDQVLARVREQLDLPIELGGGRTAKVGASIGISFGGPDTDIDTLIRRADLAMYTAKRSGRGRSVFYDAGLEAPEVQPAGIEQCAAADGPEPRPVPAAP
ncbi:sensor domain-containing diguanylate cyclase [Blastococcus sp. CT_GayMR19]|uniref:sensor domain-containing diguanylate cyclase n=1 Tax=Blastococcus sp. CT_GayMR19 TaxID=2559608 RepID=UPI00107317D5|nr:sensor domain-containing diguanylate cyclase [Blastococcus sp. CT_GayMR19]TFV76788.1 sensor domain-containing diguanylate cyclase [Blastococcus sp. CT_GayMR19]